MFPPHLILHSFDEKDIINCIITDNARISFSDLYSISHVTDGTMTIKNGKRGCMYGGIGGILLGFFSALVNDKGPPMNPFVFGVNWDGIIIDERTKSYK